MNLHLIFMMKLSEHDFLGFFLIRISYFYMYHALTSKAEESIITLRNKDHFTDF